MDEREERVTIAAYRCLGPSREAGRATVLITPEAPASPMLNRVVGLGAGRAATESDVDDALAAIPAATTYYVAVAPSARPAELGAWLTARGLEPGWGWMAFRRGAEGLAPPRTTLRLARVSSPAAGEAFAHIVRAGYDLPETADAAILRALDTDWEAWLALDGDRPVGAAALFAQEGVCYLGFAATLAAYRGKGAQSALLAHRIARAAEIGCDVVLTETGELRDGLPSNSYRNIMRAGFEEVGVTANWLGRVTGPIAAA